MSSILGLLVAVRFSVMSDVDVTKFQFFSLFALIIELHCAIFCVKNVSQCRYQSRKNKSNARYIFYNYNNKNH